MECDAEIPSPNEAGADDSAPPSAAAPRSADALLEALSDVVFELDGHGRWVSVNPGVLSLLGFSPDELVGRPFVERVAKEQHETAQRLLERALKSGRSGAYVLSLATKQGETLSARLALAPLRDAEGQVVGLAASLSDVSSLLARKRREARATRRRATAALADGTAHAYSQYLTAMMGNADLALLKVGDKKACRRHLRSVMHAALRARDLSEQLQSYAGRRTSAFEEEELASVVRRVEPLVRQVLPSGVELHVSLPQRSLYAQMNAAQFSQALLTLMVRAGRAIGDELGLIKLDVSERDIRAREAATLQIPRGPTAVFELTDSGTAIAEDQLDRIFEPFSDERGSRGTGLELAAVEGILERHQGRAQVRSTPGQGTTFTLYLPILDPEAPGSGEAAPSAAPSVRVPEIRRVAIVDDDAIVRDTMVAMLRAFDIEAIVPASPENALEVLSVEAPRIDALVTDVSMPGMTGPELTIALRAVHPDLPVLLVSGHTDVSLEGMCEQTHAVGFLPKPFTACQLMAALRALMVLPRRGRSHADHRALVPHSFGPLQS